MPIEFRCSGCGRLLRTADESAGKQAKCPECGTTQPIPHQAPPPIPLASPPPPAEEFNAYRSPAAPSAPPPDAGLGQPVIPTRIDFGELFDETWRIFKLRWGDCLLAFVIFFGCLICLGVVMTILQVAVASTHDRSLINLVSSLDTLVRWVCQTWLQTGLIIFTLRIAAGQRARFGDVFAGGPYLLRAIGGGLLVTLIVFAGMLLLIVPGIIFGLMFSQFLYLIVDQNLGVFDALGVSKQITSGNKLVYFGAMLLVGLVAMVGTLLTCMLGALVLVPFMILFQTVAYRMMAGQHRRGGPSPFAAGPGAGPLR